MKKFKYYQNINSINARVYRLSDTAGLEKWDYNQQAWRPSVFTARTADQLPYFLTPIPACEVQRIQKISPTQNATRIAKRK